MITRRLSRVLTLCCCCTGTYRNASDTDASQCVKCPATTYYALEGATGALRRVSIFVSLFCACA